MADCFILTFRAVAHASNLRWISLACDATGTLDRIDRVTQFTHFAVRARLVLTDGEDADRARRALEKAEHACLISSSLKASVHLTASIALAEQEEAPR